MAWTAFPTWVVGQVSLASDWNTYVANNMSFLATPPMARIYRNTAYTASATNTITLMPYDSVSFDSVSGFSVSTHLYTVAVAGTYLVTSQIYWSSVLDGNYMVIFTQHNGSLWNELQLTAGGNMNGGPEITDLVGPCIVGDTISSAFEVGSAYACATGPASGTAMNILKVSN